jgi:hypothetical protein
VDKKEHPHPLMVIIAAKCAQKVILLLFFMDATIAFLMYIANLMLFID